MVRVMESLAAQEVERQELLRSLQLQADRIADEAQARVQASGAAILETLAPELSRLVQRTVHQRLWTLKLRTLLAAAGAGVGLAAVIFAVSYGAGYAAGRQDGLRSARTIAAALTAGPQAAAGWVRVMAANDPVVALAALGAMKLPFGLSRRCQGARDYGGGAANSLFLADFYPVILDDITSFVNT